MAAVVDQSARLAGLSRSFGERSSQYLAGELSHIADDAINRASTMGAPRPSQGPCLPLMRHL
jgi:hypothetical protein